MRRVGGGFSTLRSGLGESRPCLSTQLNARFTAITALRRPPFQVLASSQRVTWIGFRSAARWRPQKAAKLCRKCFYQTDVARSLCLSE